MTERATELTVVRNEDASRYELWSADTLAGFSEYKDRGNRTVFLHTEIEDGFAGQGLGKVLAAGALDEAVSRGRVIVAVCPFIDGYLHKHPEYEQHVHRAGGGHE
jgi:predicted GNAT family acetyltransferase